MKPLTLSIIIPVYNDAHHLQVCLESIARQYEPADEVIVVDNNSTDDSASVAASFHFVTVIHEKQQGICWARNAGFNAASSEIIGRIDADSVLPRHWTRHVRTYLGKYPEHALTGGSYFYDLKIPRIAGWLQGQIAFRANRFIMGYYITWGSNMAMPRKLWDTVKEEVHNQPDIHEDMDLAMHLHMYGYRITYQAGFKVGVDSRLLSNKRRTRQQHMKYLKMWPRTLELHHMQRAWMGWVGVYIVYVSYVPMWAVNKAGGLFHSTR